MKYSLLGLFVLVLLAACQRRWSAAPSPAPIDALLEDTRQRFAPDKRVALWEVSALPQGGQLLLKGETTLPQARQYILHQAQLQGIALVDSIVLLPAAALGPDTLALVRQSVANLRTEARHSAEMATQALMGTPLRVFKKQGDWYLVQTPDGYIAWLDSGGLTLRNEAQMAAWRAAPRLIFLGDYHILYPADGHEAPPLGDLVTGAILEKIAQHGPEVHVRLPDGQISSLPVAEVRELDAWLSGTPSHTPALLTTASRFLGRPYLWGGSSGKGLDCSGFTKSVYFLHGYIIPRDASQQVRAGLEVPTDTSLVNLLPGDFLFFGSYRPDGSEKITHVGIYSGEGYFIHSGADNGCVRIESLRRGDPLFAPHRLQSLLRARRLSPGSSQVNSIRHSSWYGYSN